MSGGEFLLYGALNVVLLIILFFIMWLTDKYLR